jgi:hypothetical protein
MASVAGTKEFQRKAAQAQRNLDTDFTNFHEFNRHHRRPQGQGCGTMLANGFFEGNISIRWNLSSVGEKEARCLRRKFVVSNAQMFTG